MGKAFSRTTLLRWRGSTPSEGARLASADPLPAVGAGALCQLSKPFKPAAAVIQIGVKVNFRALPDQAVGTGQSVVLRERRAASQNQSKERHAKEGSASERYVLVAHRLIAYGDFISYRDLSQWSHNCSALHGHASSASAKPEPWTRYERRDIEEKENKIPI